MKFKFIFAWYDLWIGFYWDKKKRKLYFLPLPTVGLVIYIPQKKWFASKIQDIHYSIFVWYHKARIKQHFKKIAWTEKWVMHKTIGSGSVKEACYNLSYELIQDYEGCKYFSECKLVHNRQIHRFCQGLIMKRFEEGWR